MKTRTFLFLLLTTLISCSPDKADLRDIKGRFVYQADYQDTIDVSSNGTYSNYKWSDGRKLTNTGTWTYDSLKGQVHFDNFSFLNDTLHLGDSTFIPRGQWRTSVEASGQEIRIVKSRETRKGYFLKIDSLDRKD